MKRIVIFQVLFILLGATIPVRAYCQEQDLYSMDVADFFNLYSEVFTAGKKEQKLRETPSAIHILTQEDIKRSGATLLPDVLRLVPGLQVAKISSHKWAISIRGVNELFGNKLLVLIDGAPIVTPLFNGVFWEGLNLPLNTIERIEVVRGPGSAVWGSRAVNGVINIITFSSKNIEEARLTVGGGDQRKASVQFTQSSKVSEDMSASYYLKWDNHDNSKGLVERNLNDDWNILSYGARTDVSLTDDSSFLVSTHGFYKEEDFEWDVPSLDTFVQRAEDRRRHFNQILTFQWSKEFEDYSKLNVNWSNFFESRKDFSLDYSLYNLDLDVVYRLAPIKNHDVSLGTNFRFYTDDTNGSFFASFEPNDRSIEFYRGFINDEIALVKDELNLTIGSRFEQNAQVGFSAYPTARLMWTPHKQISVWSAVSYTEGTASRVNDDISLAAQAFPEPNSGLPALVSIQGQRGVKAEKLVAYELGIRAEPSKNLFIDLASFYFRYDDVITREFGQPFPSTNASLAPHIVVPLVYGNNLAAESHGLELSADYKASERLRLVTTYSLFYVSASSSTTSDPTGIDFWENQPRHSATARASYDIFEDFEFDTVLRYMDRLKRKDVDNYLQLDVRAAWEVTQDFEISIIGQNLAKSGHQEFAPWTFQSPLSQVERSFFVQASHKF